MADFFQGNDYRALPRAPETWVVRDLLPVGGLLNIYGAPKAGKSYAALQMALDISNEASQWFGFEIPTPGPVLYLQLDTPRSIWADRLDSVAQAGLDVNSTLFADRELAPFPFNILGAGFAWLRQQADELKPVAIFIDTIREIHDGDENDSAQMKKVVSAVVAATIPSSVIFISHSRKDNYNLPPDQRENLLHDNRGSSYVAGRMDGILRVSKRGFTYQSRTIDQHILHVKRLSNGLWMRYGAHGEVWDAALREVVADPSFITDTQRAIELARRTGENIEACRSAIRRGEHTRT